MFFGNCPGRLKFKSDLPLQVRCETFGRHTPRINADSLQRFAPPSHAFVAGQAFF